LISPYGGFPLPTAKNRLQGKYERFRAIPREGREYEIIKGMFPELRSTFPCKIILSKRRIKGKGFALPPVALDTRIYKGFPSLLDTIEITAIYKNHVTP
jgi:hypothetical protein